MNSENKKHWSKMSKMYKRDMSFKTRMPHACGLARALGARPRDACRLTHSAVERSSAAQVDAHAARPRSRVAVHIRDALTAESALVFSRFCKCAVFLNSVTGVKIASRSACRGMCSIRTGKRKAWGICVTALDSVRNVADFLLTSYEVLLMRAAIIQQERIQNRVLSRDAPGP